ncbi:hypothetical protein [Teredinibacter haidensis]|uniref:hypothetical protein n=1 Tax=Teredinibacter haidensis TaxID=2731755 RepID=UPI000948B9CF|nr:hypothetical protein [Teredinibacter haidensis]
MFNVPFKLREPNGLIVPKGPNFAWARTIRSEIDGTEICFKAPKHRPRRSNDKPIFPERYNNAKKTLLYRNYYDEGEAARGLADHWREADFFYHAWAFYGPWFTGAMAELDLSFNLIKVINYPKNVSLFHPRTLELVIGDYLTNLYSHHLSETRGGIQVFKAPINWQPLHHLPVNAARLEVVSEDFSPHRTIKHLLFFPIADDQMARLIFYPTRFKGLPRAEQDKLVSVQPMYDLMDNIINSIQLTLSPEAQAQKDAALAGMEDTSLVQNYAPLKWDKLDEEEKIKILANENK